jgi:hypothetical protein
MSEVHRTHLLKPCEKGYEQRSGHRLTGIRRAKWTEKPLCGGPQGYAASASEAFRTVSLASLVNKDER